METKDLTQKDFCGIVIHVDEMKSIEWKGVDVVPIKDRRCNVPNWAKVIERVQTGKSVSNFELDAIQDWRSCVVGVLAKKEMGTYKFKKLVPFGLELFLTKAAEEHGAEITWGLDCYSNWQDAFRDFGDAFDRDRMKKHAKRVVKHYKAVNKLKTVVKKKYLKMSVKQIQEEIDNG